MIQGKELKNLALKSLVIMGLWTIVILLISSTTFLSFLQEGSSRGVAEVIIYEFLCISPWIVLTPAIIWLARNYRFKKPELYKSIGIHLATASVVFSLHSIVQSYINSFYYEMPFTLAYIQNDFLGFLDMRVMLYTGILLAVYTIDFKKKDRETRLNESRLKAELSKARFHALLNQVQPDFLLNSIDAIKESLDRGEEESEEILNEFSDLLRIMLSNVKKDEITIKEDLESYRLYTRILQKRLGQSITIKSDIEEECYEALVPSFLMLIPVFEQIAGSMDLKTDAIHSISYNARRSVRKLYLEAIIEGKNMPGKDVPKILEKVSFPDIVKKFQSKYGEDIKFATRTEADRICITFMIPFLLAEDNYELTDMA